METEPLCAPFPWYGGKSRAAPLIWPRFGGVPNYVEPFAGSLAVLLGRPHPPGIETVNDLDCYLANFWRAVAAAPAEVARWADWPVNECVPGGTMIATPAGDVPVEAIRPGMVVWGERDGCPVPSVVRAIKHNQATDFRQVGPLWLTGNHPVWTREHGYVEADSLAPGMHIATLDRPRADLRIDHRRLTGAGGERSVGLSGHSEGWALQRVALPAPVAVFNFETTTHNYFAAGVLVHNCDLHARHRWLLDRAAFRARMRSDPDYYDPRIAGWWVWGLSQWIGTGWCGETWFGDTDTPPIARPRPQAWQKRPHLTGAGRGSHRATLPDGLGPQAWQQRPHLIGAGMGSHRVGAPGLVQWFAALAERLRRVRVCCGDWQRVLGPTPTEQNGVTAILLDPPYSHRERDRQLYGVEQDVAADVADWARAHGDNPRLRIALCGYDGEHVMPATWRVARWKANGGYGNQATGRGRANAERETIWFSPHCLPAVEQHHFW